MKADNEQRLPAMVNPAGYYSSGPYPCSTGTSDTSEGEMGIINFRAWRTRNSVNVLLAQARDALYQHRELNLSLRSAQTKCLNH